MPLSFSRAESGFWHGRFFAGKTAFGSFWARRVSISPKTRLCADAFRCYNKSVRILIRNDWFFRRIFMKVSAMHAAGVNPARFLLPAGGDMSKWSVIALRPVHFSARILGSARPLRRRRAVRAAADFARGVSGRRRFGREDRRRRPRNGRCCVARCAARDETRLRRHRADDRLGRAARRGLHDRSGMLRPRRARQHPPDGGDDRLARSPAHARSKKRAA